MFRRFRGAFALVTVLAIVGLAAWIYRAGATRFPIQETVLTNGITLRLVSVQYGLSHTDPFLPPWQQWASRLPERWTRRMGLNLPAKLGAMGSNATLSVWLSASKTPGFPNQPGYGVLVGDDDWNFAGLARETSPIVGTTPLIAHYEGQCIPVFPRRSKELRIRIYDTPWGNGRLLHEFRIPNPARVSTNEVAPWVAEPLPQSRKSGDLEATMVALQVWPSSHGVTFGDLAWHQVRLEFTFTQGGQQTTNWVASHVRLSDATGNAAAGTGPHSWSMDRSYLVFSRWPLPLGEAWQMEVEFCQRHGFATNELWEVRKVPIGNATTALIPMTNRMSGTEVWITALQNSDINAFRHLGLRGVDLDVGAGSPPDGRRWHLTIAKAIDSTGRDVTANQWTESGFENNRQFHFNVSTNATSLDLWLAYVPGRTMEFTAQPTRYTPRVKPPAGSRTSP
jgi:hypothetical protein